jgi:hypothetical protein
MILGQKQKMWSLVRSTGQERRGVERRGVGVNSFVSDKPQYTFKQTCKLNEVDSV